jgi:hypothetical protein
MHAQGEPIDDHLFQRVGKEFAISGGTAKNYYYNKDKQMLLDLSTAIVCLAAGGPDRLKAVVAQIVAQMETTSKKSQNT